MNDCSASRLSISAFGIAARNEEPPGAHILSLKMRLLRWHARTCLLRKGMARDMFWPDKTLHHGKSAMHPQTLNPDRAICQSKPIFDPDLEGSLPG